MSDLIYTGGDFMQILIIEDEKRLADALGQIMQEARYQADIVYDGRDGLAYASSGDYDVIVLDVMLCPAWMVLRSYIICGSPKFPHRSSC